MITGVVTNMDGEFSVNIPRGAQLKFSFVGYSEQVISPKGNEIKIELKEDAEVMDEVVVNGFSHALNKHLRVLHELLLQSNC